MSRNAFTLIEILVVVVIIGIMAAFGTPTFVKTVNRSKARMAITNSNMIHALNVLYRSRTGVNLTTAANYSAINTALGLNIVSNGVTYECDNVPAANKCKAALASVFTVTTDLNVVLGTTNPTCTPIAAGACP